MAKSLPFPSLLFLFFCIIFSIGSATSSCPIDLSYVETFPWNTTLCRNPSVKQCCQTLLSLFGIGLAQHLKDTSMFQLPDAATSSSCLSNFKTKLATLSIQPSLVTDCFQNSTQFVANRSRCAGIVTTQDWTEKLGPATLLNAYCQGDLTGLTRCSSCVDAGMSVTSQLTGLDPNGTKCFYFTVLYAAGIVNQFGPKDSRTAACILGLQLTRSADKSSSHLSRKTVTKVIFGGLGALLGVLLAFGVVILYRKLDKKKRQNALHEEYEFDWSRHIWSSVQGALSDGTLVAVKQILDLDSKGDEDFCNEVDIISKIRHRNLLPLRGCCVTSHNLKGKRRFLVYDFMSNGSLSDQMSTSGAQEPSRKKLTWPQRKNIILDVAKGLAYLHYGIRPAIYHRDIKTTNILLDSEMKARVADFGLAKQSSEGQSHLTTRVAGTHGYLAPEYALYGQLTEKSDVYSFGIVILEILSGRKVLDTSSSSVLLITDWAWMLAKSGRVEEIFDESMREEGPKGVMERFVLVGMLCAHVMVAFRPTIADALKMLEGDIDIPRLPDRPLPLSHESFSSSLQHSISASERSNAQLKQ
ncbi:hypothetical protein CJ030_MR0G007019 [Morella rubra]|uniref:non-specific serine/threonine protein kinase n=1 Tax=Morella rubra TaxID=262757 RepID=A0A6A1UJD9_9ROSI|nr:hypothetical protein CJ030_MR0G007017 [Morella rubra]KAB1200527.1 hypothetical protein CJ030_MR0G007019 [Morella rubra]